MLQFYFLSILLNAITGVILLFADEDAADIGVSERIPAFARDETIRLMIGILAGVTGFFKLLTAIRGDVPVIGDLVPALAGLAGGFTLIYEYYRTRADVDETALPVFIRSVVSSKRYVAFACIGAACLHFLFPNVLFL